MANLTHDLSTLDTQARQFLDSKKGHYIGGTWITNEELIPVIDPSSGLQVSEICAGGEPEVDAAVRAAHAAFQHPSWKNLPPLERERMIIQLAELVEKQIDLLAQIESIDNGMPIDFARLNVMGAAGILRYMAGWASKVTGETVDVKMPFPSQFFAYTSREPLGVVGAIIPWNVPLMMAIWKLAPALTAGCTVVLKPAENTSLTAIILADLVEKAGFPKGVVNIVTGYGHIAGESLVKHPLVSKISFTGSTVTGKHINRTATESLKKVTLELGGKSPTIIFDDADIEKAVMGAASAIFTNAGQICVAGSRLYVQRKVYDEVVSRIAKRADTISLGAGLCSGSEMGPLISDVQLNRVKGYVEGAVSMGAQLATSRKVDNTSGYFMAPSVVAGVNQKDPIVQEEVFGPVLAVQPFDELDEVAELANDTVYGLSACVFSQDVNRIHQLIPMLKSGKVSVNHAGFPYPGLPEGGTKQSGFGRDLGRESLDGYLETKSVLMQVG